MLLRRKSNEKEISKWTEGLSLGHIFVLGVALAVLFLPLCVILFIWVVSLLYF